MPARQTPKIEALVVNAIRRLQDVQGSTSREISNYISQEYGIPGKEISRQMQVALQRGLSYGILQQSKRGHYTCNRDYLGQLPLENEMDDGVMEPCPPGTSRWWFIWRARRRKERRERARRRRRSQRGRRRRRGRSRRRARRGRRGRGRRRSRRRRRRRRGGRRRRGRGRTRRRSGRRASTCADLSEAEMEPMAPEPKRSDAAGDVDLRESESSMSEHSDERRPRDSRQDS